MKHLHRIAFTVLMGALAWGGTMGTASASEGIVIRPTLLQSNVRAQLQKDISLARTKHPTVFAQARDVALNAGKMDAMKRGRFAPIKQYFRALGPDALLPMLEMIAIDGPQTSGLKPTARIALRAGLIEAVGALRDPRSMPVLLAVLNSNETEYYTVRAAAEALGKLGNDTAAAKLITMAKANDVKSLAVLDGMSECRRTAVANFLATRVNTSSDDEALVVIRSLGRVGSSWAWKTPAVAVSGESDATRAAAAAALVKAFVMYDGYARQKASNSLMMVDHSSTPNLIAAARASASPALAVELDKLAARFAKNPAR
jgi:hypothetical protein